MALSEKELPNELSPASVAEKIILRNDTWIFKITHVCNAHLLYSKISEI